MSNNQQVYDDEKAARELQQAELGQAGAGDAQLAYGAPKPTQYGYGGPPVVQGIPVPAAGAAQGMPITGSVPTAGRYAGYPLGARAVAVVDENAVIELTVLRFRFSVMCFAFIDVFFTVFRISQAIADYYLIKEDPTYSSSFKTWDSPTNIWWFGLMGLVFLIGPLCGYVGAKGLRRNFVTIYLAFCACNMAYDIALAVLTAHIWLFFTAIIQLWITKIVFNFWRALGLLSQDRCAELLKPDYTPNEPVRLVYW
jgi:hypothetical protein